MTLLYWGLNSFNIVSTCDQVCGMLMRQRQNFVTSAGTKEGGLESAGFTDKSLEQPAPLVFRHSDEDLRGQPFRQAAISKGS